jgi:hypothetical protein
MQLLEVYSKTEKTIFEEVYEEIIEDILKEDLVDKLINKINNPFIKGYLKLTSKPIPAQSITKNLGLDKFKNVYFQKLINVPFPIYIITVDSRFPSRAIPTNQAKNAKTTSFKRIITTSDSLISVAPKLSTLRKLDPVSKTQIPKGALIIIRDLAGENYINKKLYN